MAKNSSVRFFAKLFSFSGNLTYNLRSKPCYFTTMTEKVVIGTHNGCFHCDEALACFMLKILPQYKNAEIKRTRDGSVLETCDIVVDVGGEYDHSKRRYDHHMREFQESLSTLIKKPGYDCKIKLSSAGLIYCHYGHEIIKNILPQADDKTVEILFKYVYENFIKEIDAIDNGVSMCAEPLYFIRSDLSSRVSFLNPAWNNKNLDPDKQFLKAVELTGQEFVHCVKYGMDVWLPARTIVEDAVAKRFEIDPSGEIMEFEQPTMWAEHLYTIEKEQNIQPLLKYVIFKNDDYKICAVHLRPRSFACRMYLPEKWAGLRDETLAKVCGVEGAVFVHSGRFIGGNITREGALMMARKALEINKATS